MERAVAEVRFRRLFAAHYGTVLRYFVRRLGPDAAPDAAEDVFLVAWRKLDRVPVDDEAILWLFGVARNVLANHERSSRRRIRLRARLAREMRRSDRVPDVVAGTAIGSHDIRVALDELSERDRELLRLSAWDGLSHREIARISGCSENAVGVRLHRARQRLAKAMGADGHRRVNRAAHAAEGDEPG